MCCYARTSAPLRDAEVLAGMGDAAAAAPRGGPPSTRATPLRSASGFFGQKLAGRRASKHSGLPAASSQHRRPGRLAIDRGALRLRRLASLLGVPRVQATMSAVAMVAAAGNKIESLRLWASGRCLSADRAGGHALTEVVAGRRRRVVWELGVWLVIL